MGVCFDFYRSLRRYLRWGRVSTWAGDILFSLITLVILFRFFQQANALDFRMYILWGSILGIFLYLRLLSRTLIKVYIQLFRLISYLFWLLRQGLKVPLRGVFILMRPPYALLRWFSFLGYRILEAALAQPLRQTRGRIFDFWNTLFPPRTKG